MRQSNSSNIIGCGKFCVGNASDLIGDGTHRSTFSLRNGNTTCFLTSQHVRPSQRRCTVHGSSISAMVRATMAFEQHLQSIGTLVPPSSPQVFDTHLSHHDTNYFRDFN